MVTGNSTRMLTVLVRIPILEMVTILGMEIIKRTVTILRIKTLLKHV